MADGGLWIAAWTLSLLTTVAIHHGESSSSDAFEQGLVRGQFVDGGEDGLHSGVFEKR